MLLPEGQIDEKGHSPAPKRTKRYTITKQLLSAVQRQVAFAKPLSISVSFCGIRAGDKQPFNYFKALHPTVCGFK